MIRIKFGTSRDSALGLALPTRAHYLRFATRCARRRTLRVTVFDWLAAGRPPAGVFSSSASAPLLAESLVFALTPCDHIEDAKGGYMFTQSGLVPQS
jgi:hypothetical protein